MPSEIWIGIIIALLFIAAESSSWIPIEWRKHKARQKAIASKPVSMPLSYNKDRSLNYWEGRGRR